MDDGVNLSLGEGSSVPVRAKTEFDPEDVVVDEGAFTKITRGSSVSTFTNANTVRVTLNRREGQSRWQRSPSSITGSRDEFTLERVQPGIYEMQFSPTGPFYVQSEVSGSTNLLRE
jgi:hypothetical protein